MRRALSPPSHTRTRDLRARRVRADGGLRAGQRHGGEAADQASEIGEKSTAGKRCGAVGEPMVHFEVGAPPILVYFSGD